MARRTAAAVLAGGIALALAACAGGSGGSGGPGSGDGATGEITFTWWGNEERAAQFEQALDLFTEEHPDIEVLRNFNSWADYWTARNTEAAGRSLPDVVMMDVGYLGQYAQKDLFLDLSEYEGDTLDTSGFSDTLLGSGTVDDRLLGVPLGSGVWSMMYNKDLLDGLGVEYPTDAMDWDDFADWSREVNEAGAAVSPTQYGAEDPTGSLPSFMYHLMQDGNEVFTEDGQAAFTEEDVVDFLETGDEQREDGTYFPAERSAALTPLGGFGAGQVATWFNWSTVLTQGVADTGTENLGMVTPPLEPGADSHVLSEKASMLLTVASTTEKPEAAVTLVDFLANSPEVAAIFGTSLGTPATQERRDAVDKSAADVVVDAYLADVADQVTVSYPLLPVGYGSIEAKWVELHEQIRYGQITSEEFATELFAEMSLALNG
ncbi:ABC transporter substrate-binding protein [Cellulomonas triticagri]|uniref:Extracellular solute-binding protein n=1 Tax=Cellulomonas triticagri TaxID=2483352 RepID=A0A3M2J625_9CELL|nr:extracellular solute-binding protein [Cellulomonas triticagri]RMI06983.1 extracellular solute-binding protein [Cellulomonas triticagri]